MSWRYPPVGRVRQSLRGLHRHLPPLEGDPRLELDGRVALQALRIGPLRFRVLEGGHGLGGRERERVPLHGGEGKSATCCTFDPGGDEPIPDLVLHKHVAP